MEPAHRTAPPSTDATSAPDDIDMDDGTATEAGDMMVRHGGSTGVIGCKATTGAADILGPSRTVLQVLLRSAAGKQHLDRTTQWFCSATKNDSLVQR